MMVYRTEARITGIAPLELTDSTLLWVFRLMGRWMIVPDTALRQAVCLVVRTREETLTVVRCPLSGMVTVQSGDWSWDGQTSIKRSCVLRNVTGVAIVQLTGMPLDGPPGDDRLRLAIGRFGPLRTTWAHVRRLRDRRPEQFAFALANDPMTTTKMVTTMAPEDLVYATIPSPSVTQQSEGSMRQTVSVLMKPLQEIAENFSRGTVHTANLPVICVERSGRQYRTTDRRNWRIGNSLLLGSVYVVDRKNQYVQRVTAPTGVWIDPTVLTLWFGENARIATVHLDTPTRLPPGHRFWGLDAAIVRTLNVPTRSSSSAEKTASHFSPAQTPATSMIGSRQRQR